MTRAPEVALEGGITPVKGAPSTWTIADLNRIAGTPAIDNLCCPCSGGGPHWP